MDHGAGTGNGDRLPPAAQEESGGFDYGVALVVAAMIFSAFDYRRLPQNRVSGSGKGLLFAVVAGRLMGFF